LEQVLSKPDWQREAREQVWAEKGYMLNREGAVTNPDGARMTIDADTGADKTRCRHRQGAYHGGGDPAV
jgi:hypothetical protein